ncbi:hypothetical protein KR044_012281 [Drosophila immigrans]|nr:hypothetical protein KR044_012281 [Drosophila immigrans]
MSAFNRKVLMKMCSGSSTFDMDESGYASFRALHNSTVEAPFLCEETENCLNASNTSTTCGGLRKATTTTTGSTTTFNSMQFQTPTSSNEFNSNTNTNINTTLWRNNKSLTLSTAAMATSGLEIEDDEMCCKSPLPLSVSMPPGANKRRKPQYQPHMAHHSSPKKSKKKLFPQPIIDPLCRTRYYNGIEQLDIVGMLIHKVPALECILSKLSSSTLDTMTKVSQLWAQAVYRSERARERLENHRFKMSLTKENTLHSVKGERKLSRSNNNCNQVPLQPSNAIHIPNNRQDIIFNRNVPMEDNCCALVEQSQRIKCPRCGKSSKVFFSQSSSQQTPQRSRYPRAAPALSQTLPHSYAMSQECKPSLMRFYSLDEVKSSSPGENESQFPYTFGECTSMQCKFRFCVHCCSAPHPGEKCLVTELGTPSKVMMPGEKWTPPKHTQKYDSKLSRKKSLKRLNF